jgi:hypothetical protein
VDVSKVTGLPQWKISDFETGRQEPTPEERKKLMSIFTEGQGGESSDRP